MIGAGPIGRRIAAQLETMGMDVCLVDLSPVNLYAFAQQGFRTIAGDGQEPEVLYHAGVPHASLVVVTVPDDAVALQIVRVVRHLAHNVPILVRCRYQASIPLFKRGWCDGGGSRGSGSQLSTSETFGRSSARRPPILVSPHATGSS